MITRVRVKNFRSLADVDVTLGPLTVLVGQNGAGKSAFIDALRFLRDVLRYNLDVAFEKRNGLMSVLGRVPCDSHNDIEITVLGQQEDVFVEYSLRLGLDANDEHSIKMEACRVGKEPDALSTLYKSELGIIEKTPDNWPFPKKLDAHSRKEEVSLKLLTAVSEDAERLVRTLTAADFYALYPNSLRAPQAYSHQFALAENAENLASVLRRMYSESRQNLVALLQLFVEDVEDIKVEKIGDYLAVQLKHRLKNKDSYWLNLSQESDGTVRLLALLTALQQTAGHKMIAVEEPELFLYPRSLALLSGVIKEAALSHQLIVTTQSPDFISEFSPDQLRVVEKMDGVTHIGSLDKIQYSIIHDELFTTGDLLRVEGLRSLPAEPVSVDVA